MHEIKSINVPLGVLGIIFLIAGLGSFLDFFAFFMDGEMGASIAFFFLTFVFISTALISLHLGWGQLYKRKKLLSTGICCEAKVIDLEYDNVIRIKRYGALSRYPIILTVSYTYKNAVKTVRSKRLYQHYLELDIQKYSAKVWVNEEKSDDVYIQLFYDMSI